MLEPLEFAAIGLAVGVLMVVIGSFAQPAAAQEAGSPPPLDQRAPAAVETATFGLG